jgi:hypothetical protein
MCLETLFIKFSTYLFHFASSLNVIPKCLWSDVSGINFPSKCSLSRLFADDTSLGYSSQDEAQIKYVINHDFHELGDWSKRWLMSFNPDKTEM